MGTAEIVTIDGHQQIKFTPNADLQELSQGEVRELTFTYTISDGQGGVDTATTTIAVTGTNDGPVAVNDVAEVLENASVTIDVLANDKDVDAGDVLTIDSVISPIVEAGVTLGTAEIVGTVPDQKIEFTPSAAFNSLSKDQQSDVVIHYRIKDSQDATSDAQIAVTVRGVNDAVVIDTANKPTFDTNEDTMITITQEQLLANASDVDSNDTLTVTDLTVPDGFTVHQNTETGHYEITPKDNFSGDFDISFKVTDGQGSTVSSTANVTVAGVADDTNITITNAVDSANASFASLSAGTQSSTNIVFASDDFESGDGGWNATTGDSGNFGTGTMLGQMGGSNSIESISKTYDVPNGVNEIELSFTLHEINSWDDEHFSIFINGQKYTGTNFTSGTGSETGTTNLMNAAGDIVGVVTHGQNAIQSGTGDFGGQNWSQSHQVTLTVPINAGEDKVTVGFGAQLDGTLTNESWGVDNIELAISSEHPIVSGTEDTAVPLNIELAQQDTDDSETITSLIMTVPDTVTLSAGTKNDDGTWSLTSEQLTDLQVIPNANFNGLVELSLAVTSVESANNNSNTSNQSFNVYFEAVNDAVVINPANPLTFDTNEDTMITITQEQLLANASDVDSNDTLTVTDLTVPDGFTVHQNTAGDYEVTPKDNFSGDFDISFKVTDGQGSTVSSTANVTVAGVADDTNITITNAVDSANASFASLSAGTQSNTNIVFASDDFESGDGGWNATTGDSANLGTGDMLGQFGNSNGQQVISKTYDVPSGVNEIELSFTIHEISSWNNEVFSIFINGQQYTATHLSMPDHGLDDVGSTDLFDSSGNKVGEIVHGTDGIASGIGQYGTQNWSQSHQVTLTVPIAANQDTVTVGFGAQLDGDLANESWGVDNIELAISSEHPIVSGTEDTAVTLNIELAQQDTDDSETITSLIMTVPDTVTLSAGTKNDDGTWSLTSEQLTDLQVIPNANFNGLVELSLAVTSVETANNNSNTSNQSFNVYFEAVNDAVVIDADTPLTFDATEDTAFTITEAQLLANASDVDNDNLSVTNLSIANATIERITDENTGAISFSITPAENHNGEDINISFDVSDGQGSEVASGASLTIKAVNDVVEVSSNISARVDEDGEITLSQSDLLANATDIDGDNLVATLSDIENATVTPNADGSYTIKPDDNYHGTLNLDMSITDGTQAVQSNLELTVNSINDGPVAVDDVATKGTLVLGDSDSLTIQTGLANDSGLITVSMWFKTEDNSGRLFGTHHTDGAGDRYIETRADGEMSMYTWGGGRTFQTTTTNGQNTSDGNWHHVAYSLNGEDAHLYIDGELAATSYVGSSGFDWSSFLTIGSGFTGEIRDVNIFTGTGATADEVTQLNDGNIPTTLQDNLAISMDFDEDSPFEASGQTVILNGSPQVENQIIAGELTAADNATTNFDVLANDSDVEGGLSITGVSKCG